ncbi:hypothetical protein QOZ80_5AG0401290 [Eleusine coracana subsp. coracana]|nr:hypothetical protein QOZ80_5AG0401290 [Eleusine coracana subsp. coracana]
MSYDGYDSDGDVSRYLQSPGREMYLLDLPDEHEAITHPGAGHIDQHVQMPDQAPEMGLEGPTIDAGQHQATADDVEQNARLPVPVMNVEHQPPQALILGVEQQPELGFQALILGVEQQRALSFQTQIIADANHQAATIDDIEHHQTPATDAEHQPAQVLILGVEQQTAQILDIEHQQAPLATNDVEHQTPATDNVEHHVTPVIEEVEHHQTPAMEDVQLSQGTASQEPYIILVPALEHVDNSSWVYEMLAEEDRVIFPPPSPPLEEESPVEHEVDLPTFEDDDFDYVPFVHGELDCTRCHTVREVIHQTDHRKLSFIVHTADQGSFLHAIIHRMSPDANGQFITDELAYVDFRNHTPWSVRDFIESSVEDLREIFSDRVQDLSSNISAAPPIDGDSHVELEINMMENIPIPTAVDDANAAGAAPRSPLQPVMEEVQTINAPEASFKDFSLPVTLAEENNNAESKFKPTDMLGFTPDILESSHVKPYDPDSDTNVLLYPSMIEKMREREQARVSNLTMEDAPQVFEDINEEIAREEPDFSKMASFTKLCRKNNIYRKHTSRINDLNRKIGKLYELRLNCVSTKQLLSIKRKFIAYKQEKENLFAIIGMGLQDIEHNNDDNAAPGPSGSH